MSLLKVVWKMIIFIRFVFIENQQTLLLVQIYTSKQFEVLYIFLDASLGLMKLRTHFSLVVFFRPTE